MKRQGFLLAARISAFLVFIASGNAQAAQAGEKLAPLATPEGITVQPLGLAQGYSLSKETATKLPRDKIAYANAAGLTLYTYDQDPPDQSVCTGECARLWPPALVLANTKIVPGWSMIKREDGTRQWAFNRKPLYTYSEDVDIGSIGGNSPKRFGRGAKVGPRGALSLSIPKDKPLAEGWRVALMYPVETAILPVSFVIREVGDAMAMALVDEKTGKTLYAFDGDPAKAARACSSNKCRDMWEPFVAPRMAIAQGDFGFGTRDDGVIQWTYKGKALYTFSGDLTFGDANGMNVDSRWQVAAFARYFMPPGVTTQNNRMVGRIFSTADGKTLYRRNALIYQSGGGHNLRHGDPIRPAVGRDIGIDPRCKVECDKWLPFLAPASARPWGDWSVAGRPDGSRQWTHRGYALWTYAEDKAPGDIHGNDRNEIVISHDAESVVDIGTPIDGVWLLYWVAAYP